MNKLLGIMLLAKAPCGKIAAAMWLDSETDADIKTLKATYNSRGLTTSIVLRFENDPQPEWLCYQGCKECKKENE